MEGNLLYATYNEIVCCEIRKDGGQGRHFQRYVDGITRKLDNTLYSENYNTTTSTWAKVEHGVPPGLVLGTLLFLVSINDLNKFVRDK